MSGRVLFPELEPDVVAEGWLVEPPSLTAAQVLEAIALRHPMDGFRGMPGRWVFVREVQATTGVYADVQRFDAVAIGLVPSNKYARVVYEIKVSRSDWLAELRPRLEVLDELGRRLSTHTARHVVQGLLTEDNSPWLKGLTRREFRKWDAALELSTEFWYAAPARCILESELPPEAGLVEIRAWGPARELRPRVVRAAPVRETPHPDAGFWAAVLRRAAARPRMAE